MDWSQILGDAYVDGMTDEECQAKFNELYVPKSQHETVLQKEKAFRDNLAKENADWKRKYREKQTEEERRAEELAEQQAKKDAEFGNLQRELNIIKMSKQYMGMGYDEEFATETATAFIDGDMDTVFSNQKIFSDNLRKTIKSDLMKDMPNPPAGNETKVDYSKQINEAREKNDMVTMAALIRQQAESNANNK
ncbi:hypothetical protein LI010_19965 [Enterocloster aldenensis]|uniref:hypothetical protein n=1 Tax=Enterocloster aldenensis TaxID=358742 RepID=UPI001D08AC58|nr:hypothetical protein [Enterocloster aldenensis]